MTISAIKADIRHSAVAAARRRMRNERDSKSLESAAKRMVAPKYPSRVRRCAATPEQQQQQPSVAACGEAYSEWPMPYQHEEAAGLRNTLLRSSVHSSTESGSSPVGLASDDTDCADLTPCEADVPEPEYVDQSTPCDYEPSTDVAWPSLPLSSSAYKQSPSIALFAAFVNLSEDEPEAATMSSPSTRPRSEEVVAALDVSVLQGYVDGHVQREYAALQKDRDMRAKKALAAHETKCRAVSAVSRGPMAFSKPFAEVLNYNPSPAVVVYLTQPLPTRCAPLAKSGPLAELNSYTHPSLRRRTDDAIRVFMDAPLWVRRVPVAVVAVVESFRRSRKGPLSGVRRRIVAKIVVGDFIAKQRAAASVIG